MELQFKEITAERLGEMMPFYSMRHNRTCDSVFLESFIWKEFYQVRYAIWEGRALLWLMENKGKCFSAMPLCREEDLPDAFHAIEQYFNEELGYPLVINLADEFAVNYLDLPPEKYLVEEQVDAKDYLYDGEAMRTLAGKKLHKKKNRVNAFKREYEGRYEYRRLCCSDSQEVWQFLDKWREQKGEEAEEHLDYEVRGIHDILKNCSELYVRMGGVYIDGALEAFTIGSYNPVENMAVIHIEKANPEINGLYQYINQQFLLEEFPEVQWVNREDDMGLEGLRRAKQSYMPADYARKYLVEQLLDGKSGYHWAEEIENGSGGAHLDYLEDAEKAETIPLWKKCFDEDSDSFVDYYYTEKTKDNRILVKKENGLLLSMVQQNPYEIRMQDQEWNLDYLVGVATDPAHRREGHFREMFYRMLADEAGEGKPITYLVPVNPDVYSPMDFTYIGNVPQYELKEAASGLRRRTCRDLPDDCELAAFYMEGWLSARYEMYTRRDSAYVSRLVKELASENGTLEFLYDGDRLVGLQAIWGWDTREQRLLYAEDAYTVKTGEKPWNMARLVNLPALLSAFGRKSDSGEWNLLLEIEDPILPENCGTFLWSMGTEAEEDAPLQKTTETENSEAVPEHDLETDSAEVQLPCLRVSPAELVSFLFGYRRAEEIWPDASDEVRKLMAEVRVVQGVFLDEIV